MTTGSDVRSSTSTSEPTLVLGHFIGGQEVAGQSGNEGVVFNPATGLPARKVAFASVDEVDQVVAAAPC